MPLARRFPYLDGIRADILNCLNAGVEPKKVFDALSLRTKVECGEGEVTAYCKELRDEMYPAGPIRQSFFEVVPTEQIWPDSQSVLQIGTDPISLKDCYGGFLVTGSPGSGKSTASGRMLMLELLKLGCGALITTTTKDEALNAAMVAMMAGRGPDVLIIQPEGWLTLNVLDYEKSRPGGGGALTENLMSLLRNLVSLVARRAGQPANEGFWRLAGDQLLRNLINLLNAAKATLSFDLLCRVVTMAPATPEKAADGAYQMIPVFGEVMAAAERNAAGSPPDQRVLQILKDYWLQAFPQLPSQTRSCITFAFSAMLSALREKGMYELLSDRTTITPECLLNGKILILDLPINEYGESALFVQATWKYEFMRAMLRRPDLGWGDQVRPVVLFEDEAHNFLIDFDSEFTRMARQCKCIRVVISQNLNNFYDRFGGDKAAEAKVHSILGALNLRISHANGDLTTNRFMSESIGTEERVIAEVSTTSQKGGGVDPLKELFQRIVKPSPKTTSYRTVREPVVHPHQFLELTTAGSAKGAVCEGIVTQVGRTFSNGQRYMMVTFEQILLPPPESLFVTNRE